MSRPTKLNNLKDYGTNISRPNDKDTFNRYINEIGKLKPISREEEAELFVRIKSTGDRQAIEKICRHNLLFVVSVAKRYSSMIGTSSLTLEDLISEGNLGLYTAIDRFDNTSGNKFISYAVWWVRQAILASIQNNVKTIRIPGNVKSTINKITRKENYLEQKLNRTPTTLELFEAMLEDGDITEKDGVEKIDSLIMANKFETSLSSMVGHDDGIELSETIKSHYDGPEDILIKTEREQIARDLLMSLPSIIQSYLIDYFGLFGYEQLNYRQIGEKYEVSSESVRGSIDKYLRVVKNKNRGTGNYLFPTPDYERKNLLKTLLQGDDVQYLL